MARASKKLDKVPPAQYRFYEAVLDRSNINSGNLSKKCQFWIGLLDNMCKEETIVVTITIIIVGSGN